MKALLIALLLLPLPALADCSAMFGGWSYHLDQSAEPNETHSMYGLACKRWSAMTFTNSRYKESYGIGYEKPLGGVFSAYGALWTGYDEYTIARPVLAARARLTAGRLSVVATTAIKVSTLHLEWRL